MHAKEFSSFMCPTLVGQDLSWRNLPGLVLAYEITQNALKRGLQQGAHAVFAIIPVIELAEAVRLEGVSSLVRTP
jgi:hypothetical protein